MVMTFFEVEKTKLLLHKRKNT